MKRPPHPLILLLVLVLSAPLTGCDATARLTEQEHIQRAKDAEDKGDLKSSIIELKNAIQKNPDSREARLLLGQVYLKAGQGAEAEKELRRAESLGVNRESLKVPLGEALVLMGEYKRVLDEIQHGEQTSKSNRARIFQIRADALLKQGKIQDACNLYQQALDTDSSHSQIYWGLAQCAVAARDMAQARSLLDRALKIDDHRAQTWIFIGEWEQLNKNNTNALAAYSNALKAEPNNLSALQSRASLNLGLGRLDNAQSDIEKLSRLAPKSLAASYLQALHSFERGDFPKAREHIQEAFKITSDYMPSILLAGAIDHQLGSYKQAESHLTRYLARYPGHAYARRVLAATQIRQGLADQALQTLAPLLSSDSQDFQALALAAEAYRIKGVPAQAAEYLARASALDPTNAEIQTHLGLTHLSAGKGDLAIGELKKAAALDATQHRADIALVLAHLQRKEFDQALSSIDSLERKLKNSPLPNTLRASAYAGKNDLPSARASLERALAIDAGYFPAAAQLARLDMLDKKPESAKRRFEQMLQKDANSLQAMMALAELAAATNNQKDHVAWLERAAKAHPTAIAPRAALVRQLLAKKEAQKALPIANETINANPDNPAALDLLGSVQLALNDTLGAISTFTRLARVADQSPNAHLQLARAQIAGGKLADARASLLRAIALNPAHEASLDTLIRLEMREKKPAQALELARQLQASRPRSLIGFEREGDIHLSQRRPELAAKSYEQALRLGAGSEGFIKFHRALVLAGNASAEKHLEDWLTGNPKDLAVQFYAAEHYATTGRQRDAIAAYQTLLSHAPKNAIALNNLANLYHLAGDARARATAERAHALNPRHPAILDTLGWILVEHGEVARGLTLIEQALAAMPGNPDIRYHRAMAWARQGDKARARQELELLLKQAPAFSQAEAARTQLRRL